MTAPFDLSLLPGSAATDAAGRTAIGGCDLVDLADRFGTPLFVYDEEELRSRARRYVHAFPGGVAYASKAFLCLAMARLAHEEGLWLDVATGGELHVALRAGFPADRIEMHGNNKADDEIVDALEAGIARVVVDSFDELDRLERLVPQHRARGERLAVHVRITPGVSGETHEHIDTGVEDSKFGFGVARGDALAAARRVSESDVLHLAGLHCHIGSQIQRVDAFERAVHKIVETIRAFEDATGASLAECNVGGGLGVRYTTDDDPPSIERYATALHEAFAKALVDVDVRSKPQLMVEPGRSIAAPAAVTLYRVGTIKRIPGVRTYVAVDGGMSDNLRPTAYGARYEAFLPARATAERPFVATVAGKHCEQGDLLVRDAALPADVAVGDVLATPCTGAYGFAMASNYNKVPRPAVVFVRDGAARLVVRRESYDDLLRLDE